MNGGNYIMTVSDDWIWVWDATKGEKLHAFDVQSVSYNTDETWSNTDRTRVAVSECTQEDEFGLKCLEFTVRIRDSETGEELFSLPGHGGRVTLVTWYADRIRSVAASSMEGRMQESDNTQMEDLLEAACQIAPRNMSSVEWQRFMRGEPYRVTCPNIKTQGIVQAGE